MIINWQSQTNEQQKRQQIRRMRAIIRTVRKRRDSARMGSAIAMVQRIVEEHLATGQEK